MTRFQGDAVAQLAHRLAYTVASSCEIKDMDRAATIVSSEINGFLLGVMEAEGLEGTPGTEQVEDAWLVMVKRCVKRVERLDRENSNGSKADVVD